MNLFCVRCGDLLRIRYILQRHGHMLRRYGQQFASIFLFYLYSHTAVNNIHLVLYGDLHVQQALALVAAEEAYSEILRLEDGPRVEDRVEGSDGTEVIQAAGFSPVLRSSIIRPEEQHIEGEVPPHFPEQASYSSHASTSLCLENQEQYTRLAHYMYTQGRHDCVPVAPDGSCMFSSLRRIISALFEYRNIHLRRQLVITLANHKEFFFNLLKEHIRGTYGFPRLSDEEYQRRYNEGLLTDQEVQDHNCPGPFSFHSYLSALLDPEMWGDEQVLCLCSMMWQIGLTVVSAENFTQIRFRHRSSLERADGVLVLCQGQHYVPACKCQSYCFCSICTLNAVCGGVSDPYCGATVTYCGATDSFCSAIVIHCSSRLLRILMSFSVRRVDGVDAAGQVTTVTYSLSPDSMTTARGYDAMREDPNIYKTLNFFGYSASRYFPDMQLPVPGVPSVSATVQPSAQQDQFDPEHLISVIQGMHDEHVHFLKPLGRDPCSYFKEKDETRILRALGPDVVVCPFCSRKFGSHHKLVSHCKRCHCQSLALKCTTCNKIFGDSYALKIHKRIHSSSARVHKCNICGKAYITKSSLNEHNKVHTIGKVPCEHCSKLFAEHKTLVVHKRTCSKRPGAENVTDEERRPHKCPHCTKRYTRVSDVARHCRLKHPGI